jgi:hypothetical protein
LRGCGANGKCGHGSQVDEGAGDGHSVLLGGSGAAMGRTLLITEP